RDKAIVAQCPLSGAKRTQGGAPPSIIFAASDPHVWSGRALQEGLKSGSAAASCRPELRAILSVPPAGGPIPVPAIFGAGDRAAVFTMILRRCVVLALASIPLLARGAFSQTAVKARRVGLLSSAAPLTDNSDVVVGLTAGFSKRGYAVGRSLVY